MLSRYSLFGKKNQIHFVGVMPLSNFGILYGQKHVVGGTAFSLDKKHVVGGILFYKHISIFLLLFFSIHVLVI